jgi:hypothetical protein
MTNCFDLNKFKCIHTKKNISNIAREIIEAMSISVIPVLNRSDNVSEINYMDIP